MIEDVCLKYACDCTIRTATKVPQPIEKSTAGASLLAQVIVAKWADHQPLHRQEKFFERHGIEISRKTMGGWMAQCVALLDPLYQLMKKELSLPLQRCGPSLVARSGVTRTPKPRPAARAVHASVIDDRTVRR
jgi:transposase